MRRLSLLARVPLLVLLVSAATACDRSSPESGVAAASASSTPGQKLCRDSDADCKVFGRCTGVVGACTATSEEDCKKASVCAQSGWCAAKDGQCVVPAGAGCASERCREYGECTQRGSECGVGSAADCKQAGICRRGGQCSFRDGKCVIGSDADCAGSWRCTHYGFCKYENGNCIKAPK